MDAFRLRSVNRVQRRRRSRAVPRGRETPAEGAEIERERVRQEEERGQRPRMERDFNEIAVMPCKWPGNSFRARSSPARRPRRLLCCARRGLTRFHTYFNTGKTVRKLRDMHKRLRKLAYKTGIARPVSRARPFHPRDHFELARYRELPSPRSPRQLTFATSSGFTDGINRCTHRRMSCFDPEAEKKLSEVS